MTTAYQLHESRVKTHGGVIAPLSFEQEGIWLISRVDPAANASYNIVSAFEVAGGFEQKSFIAAIGDILERHESLRVCFLEVDGVPFQKVKQISDVNPIIVADSNGRHSIDRIGNAERRRPFDFSVEIPFRVNLFHSCRGHRGIVFTFHHIAFDGWSSNNFLRELSELYNARTARRPPNLAPLRVSYLEYARAQRDQKADKYLSALQFWENALGNIPTIIDFPRQPNAGMSIHAAGSVSFALPEDLERRARSFASREHITLFVLLLTTFQVLVAKYSGQTDFGIRVPVANRNDSNLEALIGMFVNTIVVRSDVAWDRTFADLIRKTSRRLVEAVDYQHTPFSHVVRSLRIDRSPLREPLSQLSFNFMHDSKDGLNLGSAYVEKVPVKISSAKDDLLLEIVVLEGTLQCNFVYAKSLFERSTIERMARHYETLLEGVVANPMARVGELPLLTQPEREQILVEWNDTEVDYPSKACIHELFEAQVQKTPEAVAVAYQERQLSYRELNTQANRLAHHLRTLGVGPDKLVGICVERGLEMVVGLLAVLKAGGAYVPMDPNYPAERLAYMLQDSAPVVVLTQAGLDKKVGRVLGREAAAVPALHLGTTIQPWAQQPASNLERAAGGGLTSKHLAYVIYTSGSTGTPKGVMIEHANVVNFIRWGKSAFPSEILECTLFSTSLSFDLAAFECLVPISVGATVRIAQDAVDLVSVPRGITLINTVPSVLKALADVNGVPKTVRWVNLAGEPLKRTLVEQIFATTEVETVCNLYGPTETTTYSTWVRIGRDNVFASHIGRPIANTRIYILDAGMQPVPVGVTGEMYIGGAGVARGYLNRPELTAERFLVDPFSKEPGERIYKTGDLARYLTDGNIEFLGRNDFQIKIRGFRIELGEIEAKLTEHEGIREAVVVAREDSPGDKRLVGYYVASAEAKGEGVDTAGLRHHLSERLPAYMVPAAFVRLDKLPLTPNGKLDRKALPAPEIDAFTVPEYEAPLGEVEKSLAKIWKGLLKVDRVGRHDNFFELGGHSLLAVQVLSRVRETLKVRLSLRDFFAYPSVDQLGSIIKTINSTYDDAGISCLHRHKSLSPVDVSFAQLRLWFLDQYQPGSAVYNVPLAIRLEGQLDTAVLVRALDEILRRHDVLRTTFKVNNGFPNQVIASEQKLAYDLVGLSRAGERVIEQEVQRLVQTEVSKAFDLERGPLIRAKIFELSARDHLLLLVLHHIIFDGWSAEVLMRELSVLYCAFQRGAASPLAELSIQYADFAIWQRESLGRQTIERQLCYWKNRLAGATSILQLPIDFPRPSTRTHEGASIRFSVPKRLTERLEQLSKGNRATLFMSLMAAFNVLLSRCSNQNDLCIGYPTAGRNQPETEELIGFFVNTLVLRTYCDWDASFSSFLDQVRENVLNADMYQDVPFEKLVEELEPERDLSRLPLFEVMFALHRSEGTTLEIPGVRSLVVDVETQVAKFDLALTIREKAGQLAGIFEFNTGLFERSTIERMARHYETLLEGVVANPMARVGELPLLTQPEREQILVEWNDTEVDYPSEACIHELFEAQVQKTPEAVAVAYQERQLS